MNTLRTAQTIVMALAMMVTLMIWTAPVFGQSKDFKQLADSRTDELKAASEEKLGSSLVGVWESVSPVSIDCQTGEPSGPTIRTLYNFAAGGTMMEENTDPIEGPYRNTGHGIWQRTGGRTYMAFYMHYGYLPDNTHLVIVKVRTSITLSLDSESFDQRGTFEVLDSVGNPFLGGDGLPIKGCFKDTANRLKF